MHWVWSGKKGFCLTGGPHGSNPPCAVAVWVTIKESTGVQQSLDSCTARSAMMRLRMIGYLSFTPSYLKFDEFSPGYGCEER